MRVISFNAAMLAAVQAGHKTVTRRRFAPHLPLQLHPSHYRYHGLGEEGALFESTHPSSPGWLPVIPCPFGLPGELLRVQEDASLVIQIKSVRAEQVRNLTDADALAEGVQEREVAGYLQWGGVEPDPDVPGHYRWYDSPIGAFHALLNSIYPTAWERNEWVWVVTFAQITS